ncbi:hypothetical protein, partial [Pseudomonas sp.]|uniref:hypothetical protein n=1 Tax=Pseudomonas sp. TaxID=306 RepID=UPI003FD6E5D9
NTSDQIAKLAKVRALDRSLSRPIKHNAMAANKIFQRTGCPMDFFSKKQFEQCGKHLRDDLNS